MSPWLPTPDFADTREAFIIGGGPSLAGVDLSRIDGRHQIAVNFSYRIAPTAEVLYWGDRNWFNRNREAVQAHNARHKVSRASVFGCPWVKTVRWDGSSWSMKPGTLGGMDSGLQAANLAVHMGARQLFLLGIDMGASSDGTTHWHDLDQEETPEERFRRCFAPMWEAAAERMRESGIEVINLSLNSRLKAFPKARLEDVL